MWIAGDQTNGFKNTSNLYSTATIVPGLEQAIYNNGDFFPALARTPVGGFDGDVITVIGDLSGEVATREIDATGHLVTSPFVVIHPISTNCRNRSFGGVL